mgnify:FL=1
METSTVENQTEHLICTSCGVEFRDGAMFCYNCGTAAPSVEETEFLEAAFAEADSEAQLLKEKQAEPIDPASVSIPVGAARKSASAIKRRERRRPARPQAVEIVPQSGPQWPFVAAAGILFLIGIVIIILALYFK